jgi:multicomponent Na+:H+ antiporter subunit D
MSAEAALLSFLGIPAAGAFGVIVAGRWPNLREAITLGAGLALLASVWALLPDVLAGGRPGVMLFGLEPFPGLPLALSAEPLGMLFAVVAAFLWIVTSLYAIGYMRAHGEQNQTRFYAAFALSIACTMGVAFAANMFTLFLFYELLTLCTYPLVTHAGTEEARRGGRTYLGLLLFTSIAFQLLAIAGTWTVAGTLDFRSGGILAEASAPVAAILLTLYLFGIGKAALMPFHRWLPAAMVAPTPVSALLHAVAVVKAGVFTVLKVVVYIFGFDAVSSSGAQNLLLYVAAATILLASLVAMTRDNLKSRLAYSTVSQLGYIVLGALLASPLGVLGGAMHIAMHAFAKITLFFAAGAILVAAHRTEVSELDGLGHRMPLTFTAFTIGALGIIGLPPLGGMWSKWYLLQATLIDEHWLLLAVLLISSLLNVWYLLAIPVRAFFLPDAPGHAVVREAPAPCAVAMSVTAAACVILFFYPDLFHELAGRVAGEGASQ